MNTKQFLHLVTRFLAPATAREMERDGSLDPANYVVVQDNGADVTLFIFSGVAALFAGLPAFEFRKLLSKTDRAFNLVFLRDIHRTYYTCTPDGQPDGLAFYQRVVEEQKAALGARHNVGIGASGGAAAALYYGVLCGFDHVIAFSPVSDPSPYIRFGRRLHAIFDAKKAFTDPRAYLETLALMFVVAPWLMRRLRRAHPDGQWPDLMAPYREASERPLTTLVYGDNCLPDIEHARLFAPYPEARHRPVRSNRHTCTLDLKARGELDALLLREIEAGLAECAAAKERA